MDMKETRVKNLRDIIARYDTAADFARSHSLDPSYISQLTTGHRGFGEKAARKIEESVGLASYSLDTPTTGDNLSKGPTLDRAVPLISFVTAGDLCATEDPYQPGDAERWIETYIPVTEGMFALRVEGDSMTNPSGSPTFSDGMIIIVDPTRRAENGSLVVARDGDGRATFKKLAIEGNMVYLAPLNPRYEIIPIRNELHICGVVVAAQIDLR